MWITCPAVDRGLIRMHAPGGAGKLSLDQDRLVCFVMCVFQKKCVEGDVVRLVGIQCYRGIRHVDILPCRGNR
ncbi:hypothetical protein ACSQ67_025308 [Phaseolus vulgaris]